MAARSGGSTCAHMIFPYVASHRHVFAQRPVFHSQARSSVRFHDCPRRSLHHCILIAARVDSPRVGTFQLVFPMAASSPTTRDLCSTAALHFRASGFLTLPVLVSSSCLFSQINCLQHKALSIAVGCPFRGRTTAPHFFLCCSIPERLYTTPPNASHPLCGWHQLADGVLTPQPHRLVPSHPLTPTSGTACSILCT